MAAIIPFIISLAGITIIVAIKAVELNTGRKSFLSDLESLADKVVARNLMRTRSVITSALREGLRSAIIFFADIIIDIKQSLGLLWHKASGRLDTFMRERRIEHNGTMSIFLKNVTDHKQAFRQDR